MQWRGHVWPYLTFDVTQCISWECRSWFSWINSHDPDVDNMQWEFSHFGNVFKRAPLLERPTCFTLTYNTSLLLQDKYGWLGCFLLTTKATGTTVLTIFLRVYFPNHHALLEQIRDVSRLPTQRPLPPRWCCSPSSSSTPSLRRHYIVGHNLDKYGRLGGFLLRPQLSLSTSSGLGRRLLASCCCCYLWHHLHRHRRRNPHHFHDHLLARCRVKEINLFCSEQNMGGCSYSPN